MRAILNYNYATFGGELAPIFTRLLPARLATKLPDCEALLLAPLLQVRPEPGSTGGPSNGLLPT